MKTFINPLSKFLKTNYQYKRESCVRLRRIYENFLEILEKEDPYSKYYTFKQFRMDFDTLSSSSLYSEHIFTKQRKRVWCAINIQEKVSLNGEQPRINGIKKEMPPSKVGDLQN